MLIMSDVTGLGQDNDEEIAQIIGFIVANRAQGITDAVTMKDLIRMGTDSTTVQQAFAQLAAQQAAPPPSNGKPTPKGTPKWVFPTVVGGVSLLLLGGLIIATRK